MAVVKINKKKHIYWAEIDRPESSNAIDFEVMDMLEDILDEIENNGKTRVLILSGAGHQYFVSGRNVKAFAKLKTAEEGRQMAERMGAILHRLETGRYWTLACVNGEVYGGGCEFLLAFDFSIASKTATFAFTQASFGLTPGWGGITRLVERVGRSRTLEWLGSNQILSSEDAVNTGLINKLSITSELRRNTWEWALELSRVEPDLIEELKKGTLYAASHDRKQSLERELDRFAHFWGSSQHHQKTADFLRRSRK
ncbi:MAG: enoyl-CoA hydratase/isomerase family protein [Cyclonatronaceae bacterium]